MKVIILLVLSIFAFLMAGCALTEAQKREIKDKAHNAIIKLIEDKGEQAALDYVNELYEDGKISKNLAEKIKQAIPKGVDKLKEVLKEGGV